MSADNSLSNEEPDGGDGKSGRVLDSQEEKNRRTGRQSQKERLTFVCKWVRSLLTNYQL
jgi:hypothetical protein